MAAKQLAGKKVALVSVFDKTGVDAVAKAMVEEHGYTILSTGGTRRFLEENGVPAVEASEITGFGELLGGRVKSLHPAIFAGILAERDKLDEADYGAPEFLIDTVIVNLYPFEKERDEQILSGGNPDDLLHFIDIGGSALIRAAAKNYPSVNVIHSPAQYEAFLAELDKGEGETGLAYRKQLAHEAFRRSVGYDLAIGRYLSQSPDTDQDLDQTVLLPLMKVNDLRYGENPYQQAALYGLGTRGVDFECLHGKELSYNNILDMQAAWNIVVEFTEKPAPPPTAVIVKHNNPTGVATSDKSLADAYETAFNVDPLSAFGGVVAFNQPVDAPTAKQMKEVFLEVIIAPDFEPEALEILKAKKNLRLVKRPLPDQLLNTALEVKQVTPELFLLQKADPDKYGNPEQAAERLQVATSKKPSDEQIRDMIFAWKVVKHVKSNAIVLAKNGKTVGIGGGQTSRIGALEHALQIACDEAKDAVMASDGFLPHVDNIHAAAQNRIGAIIQPGGSIKDKDVIEQADKNEMAMVLTGVREFRH